MFGERLVVVGVGLAIFVAGLVDDAEVTVAPVFSSVPEADAVKVSVPKPDPAVQL